MVFHHDGSLDKEHEKNGIMQNDFSLHTEQKGWQEGTLANKKLAIGKMI